MCGVAITVWEMMAFAITEKGKKVLTMAKKNPILAAYEAKLEAKYCRYIGKPVWYLRK